MNLYEKYRPKEWAGVIGQDKVVEQIKQLRQRGLAGRAYWISGQSGTVFIIALFWFTGIMGLY